MASKMDNVKIAKELVKVAKTLTKTAAVDLTASEATMTIGKLKKLLSKYPDDTKIAVACAPNEAGWINNIGKRIAITDDGIVVICAEEDTIGEDEANFDWVK